VRCLDEHSACDLVSHDNNSAPGFAGGFRLTDAETPGQVSVRAARIKLIDALAR